MTHEEFITSVSHEFELAFLATGLRPVRRTWGDGVNDGCMVTALDVSEHGRKQPRTLMEELQASENAVASVVDYLACRYPQFDRSWWGVFVNYCILSFDGLATFPSQWMNRNRHTLLTGASPKLLGAAVAGLVRHSVFAEPHREEAVQTAPASTVQTESAELALVG